MGVAACLGLGAGLDSPQLTAAAERWPGWVGSDPRLAPVGGPAGLRDWLAVAAPAAADGVLVALAGMGSPDGGDSVEAAAVVAWALLPGACALAHRLRMLSPRIDEVVAGQLWLEIRSFPWRRLGRVAGNVLANTRAGVLLECGSHGRLARSDPTWASTVLVEPHRLAWRPDPVTGGAGRSAAEELLELLGRACEEGVISDADRALLVAVAVEADRVGTVRAGRGQAGLMANDVSAAVGARWGVSPKTVRRRARRSLAALSQACTSSRWAA